jgi:hypothetical protein
MTRLAGNIISKKLNTLSSTRGGGDDDASRRHKRDNWNILGSLLEYKLIKQIKATYFEGNQTIIDVYYRRFLEGEVFLKWCQKRT